MSNGFFVQPYRLEITDGTTTVDLITGVDGFRIGEGGWRPNTAEYKGGGTFQDSPLAFGRRLVDRQYTNIIDTIPLILSAMQPDYAIAQMRKLRNLLSSAEDYWAADWNTTDVYLVAQSYKESNVRYAVIYTGRVPNDTDITDSLFSTDFKGKSRSVWTGLDLIIEHGLWQDQPPNGSAILPIAMRQDFGGVIYGDYNKNSSSNVNRSGGIGDKLVFVANSATNQNLTHIFQFDASGGTFDTNVITSGNPQLFQGSGTGTGDIIYFGIETSSGRYFNAIVFDIDTVFTTGSPYTTVWEYWDGSVWSSLNAYDGTASAGSEAFTNSGVNHVAWDIPTDWASTSVNSVTAYWVRIRITAVVSPSQQALTTGVLPYAPMQNYIQVGSGDVVCDLPLLARSFLQSVETDGTVNYSDANRVIVGTRSLSRGTSFFTNINCYNIGNQSGVNVTNLPASFTASTRMFSGGYTSFSTAVGVTTIVLDNTISSSFVGRFRCFAKIGNSGVNVETINMTLSYQVGTTSNAQSITNDAVYPFGASETPVLSVLVDLGIIDIKPFRNESPESIVIKITVSSDTNPVLDIFDVSLVPVDEFYLDARCQNKLNIIDADGDYIEIDSTFVKDTIQTSPVTSYRDPAYTSISNGGFVLQSNKDQKLFFLFDVYEPNLAKSSDCDPQLIFSPLINVVKRYQSMRGNK